MTGEIRGKSLQQRCRGSWRHPGIGRYAPPRTGLDPAWGDETVERRCALRAINRRLDANSDHPTRSGDQHRPAAVPRAGIPLDFHVPPVIVSPERPYPHHERVVTVANQHELVADPWILPKCGLKRVDRQVRREGQEHDVEPTGVCRAVPYDADNLVIGAALPEEHFLSATVPGGGQPILVHHDR